MDQQHFGVCFSLHHIVPAVTMSAALDQDLAVMAEARQPSIVTAEDAKAAEKEETAEEKQTDAPAIESAPEAEYKPPVDAAEATTEATA